MYFLLSPIIACSFRKTKNTTIPYTHIYNNKSKLPTVSEFIPTSFNQKSHKWLRYVSVSPTFANLHGRHQQFGTLHLILKDVVWTYTTSIHHLKYLSKTWEFQREREREWKSWNKETSQLLGWRRFKVITHRSMCLVCNLDSLASIAQLTNSLTWISGFTRLLVWPNYPIIICIYVLCK